MTSSVITYLCARPRLKWFYRLSTPQPVFVCARVWDYSAAILSGTLISWLAARRYLLTGSRWWCWLDGARRHPSFWLANNWNPSLFRSIYSAMCVCLYVCLIPSTLSAWVHFRLPLLFSPLCFGSFHLSFCLSFLYIQLCLCLLTLHSLCFILLKCVFHSFHFYFFAFWVSSLGEWGLVMIDTQISSVLSVRVNLSNLFSYMNFVINIFSVTVF